MLTPGKCGARSTGTGPVGINQSSPRVRLCSLMPEHTVESGPNTGAHTGGPSGEQSPTTAPAKEDGSDPQSATLEDEGTSRAVPSPPGPSWAFKGRWGHRVQFSVCGSGALTCCEEGATEDPGQTSHWESDTGRGAAGRRRLQWPGQMWVGGGHPSTQTRKQLSGTGIYYQSHIRCQQDATTTKKIAHIAISMQTVKWNPSH